MSIHTHGASNPFKVGRDSVTGVHKTGGTRDLPTPKTMNKDNAAMQGGTATGSRI